MWWLVTEASPWVYFEPLDPSGRMLTLATRGARSDEERSELERHVRKLGMDACREAALTNHCEMAVGSTLRSELNLPLSPSWLEKLDANRSRVEALIAATARVCRRVVGARLAVVEGGGMLLGTKLPTDAFGASDFDILVEPEAA